MEVELVVLIAPEAYENPDTGNADVFRLAKQRNAPLAPAHRGVADEELRRYFVTRMDDAQAAEELAEQLRTQPQVEAAYVKPVGELPGM